MTRGVQPEELRLVLPESAESFDFGGLGVDCAEINRKYSLEMDFGSVPGLCERFGLTFPEL